MNNDLKPLFRKLDNSFKLVSESEDLNDLKDLYTQFELVRDEIIDWIEKRYSSDDDIFNQHINEMSRVEGQIFQKYGGVPIFDETLSDEELENLFEDYSAYFQRYGCLDYTDIISWDSRNVLIEDEIGTMEIVMRPDLLMK